MRKRNINAIFDHVFWYAVYMLPLVAYLITLANPNTASVPTLSAFLANGFAVSDGSIIYTALQDIFGTNGVMPLFNSSDVLAYCTYFANCFLVHLLIDFVLFLPRLAHAWMAEAQKGVDNG